MAVRRTAYVSRSDHTTAGVPVTCDLYVLWPPECDRIELLTLLDQAVADLRHQVWVQSA